MVNTPVAGSCTAHPGTSSCCQHLNSLLSTPSFDERRVFCSDECSYCFATRKEGLDLCLECLCCYCTSKERDHSSIHQEKTGHSLLLHIREVARPIDENATQDSSSSDAGAVEFSLKCTACNSTCKCLNDKFSKLIEQPSAIKHEISAIWQSEIKPCVHSSELKVIKGAVGQVPTSCTECPITEGIWMCISCGHCGCGRSYFDGSGGNNHALEHSQSEKHPIAVKVGTISRDGDGDAYCYECDDSVHVPNLLTHLSTLGISGFDTLTQSAKSTLQLEQEMNESFQPQSDTRSPAETPLSPAPNQVGLVNMGNTCYINSALVCLLKARAMKEFFNSMGMIHVLECRERGPNCLFCQLVKVCNALTVGESSELTPSMFRVLVGKASSQFHSNRQQDVHEFLEFLFDQFERSFELKSLLDNFLIQLTHKYKCLQCNGVLIKQENAPFLMLTLEPDHSPLTMNQLLKNLLAPSVIALKCPHCLNDSFTRESWVTRTPEHLIVMLCRYSARAGVLEKNATPVHDCAVLSLDAYVPPLDVVQPGEVMLEESVDETDLLSLMSLGFERHQCIRALKATQGQSLDAATNWLFDHPDATDTKPDESGRLDQPTKTHYSLASFIHHRGRTLSSGHYVSYCKDTLHDQWLCFNDSRVSHSTAPPVTEGYIYFYE